MWLQQPGEGRDSWPRGMGQAEADGPEWPSWRGDRWQHGTAREGGHMATRDWQEHKSLHRAKLQAWRVWICLGEGKRAFMSSHPSSDMGRDALGCRTQPWPCAAQPGRGPQPLQAAEPFSIFVLRPFQRLTSFHLTHVLTHTLEVLIFISTWFFRGREG